MWTAIMAAPLAVLLMAASPEPPALAAGQSLFDRLFPAMAADDSGGAPIRLPYPFARLLEEIAAKTGSAEIRSAFIPIGRSLHRYAADPHFFASPRIVAGITGEGRGDIATADRLYLGYQPAAQSIEIISFNDTLGRFEFQEVTGYEEGGNQRIAAAERAVCTGCHQSEGPIFAATPWSETNADAHVTARLKTEAGPSFQGLPVAQDFDGIDLLDRSTDRANRLLAAARIWKDGCGPGVAGRTCRALLLVKALRMRLGGGQDWFERADDREAAAMIVNAMHRKWPAGLTIADPKLPDRDPLKLLKPGQTLFDTIESSGPFDPATPRAGLAVWKFSGNAAQDASGTVRLLASLLGQAELRAVEADLATQGAEALAVSLPCKAAFRASTGNEEIRFICEDATNGRLEGFATISQGNVTGGRLNHLVIAARGVAKRIDLKGGSAGQSQGGQSFTLTPAASGWSLHPRLSDGMRLDDVALKIMANGEGRIVLTLTDDISAAEQALLAGARREALLDGSDSPNAIIVPLFHRAIAMKKP